MGMIFPFLPILTLRGHSKLQCIRFASLWYVVDKISCPNENTIDETGTNKKGRSMIDYEGSRALARNLVIRVADVLLGRSFGPWCLYRYRPRVQSFPERHFSRSLPDSEAIVPSTWSTARYCFSFHFQCYPFIALTNPVNSQEIYKMVRLTDDVRMYASMDWLWNLSAVYTRAMLSTITIGDWNNDESYLFFSWHRRYERLMIHEKKDSVPTKYGELICSLENLNTCLQLWHCCVSFQGDRCWRMGWWFHVAAIT